MYYIILASEGYFGIGGIFHEIHGIGDLYL